MEAPSIEQPPPKPNPLETAIKHYTEKGPSGRAAVKLLQIAKKFEDMPTQGVYLATPLVVSNIFIQNEISEISQIIAERILNNPSFTSETKVVLTFGAIFFSAVGGMALGRDIMDILKMRVQKFSLAAAPRLSKTQK